MDTNNTHVHKFTDITVEPTCRERGYTVHRCECGYEHKDNFKPMGEHRFVLQSERDVTCAEDGVKTHVCSVCGETKTEIVHSTGHVFGEINVSKYPGCSIAGEGFRICSRCGAGEDVVIPPLGHRRSGDDFRFVGDDHVEFFCQNCGETVVEPLANVNDKEILKAAAKTRKKDKKISKKKLAVIISVVSVILVLALVIAIITPYLIPMFKYKFANMLIKQEKYTAAYYQLRSIDDYKDSKTVLLDFYVKCREITVENKELNADGEFETSKYKLKFDEYGNETLEERYGIDGELKSKYSHKYEYDDDGNILEKSYYEYVDGKKKLESRNEYKYDEHGNCVLSIGYDADDKISYKNEYKYDKHGNETDRVVYNYDDGEFVDKDEYKYTNKYDGDGALISTTEYDSEGNKQREIKYYSDGKEKSYVGYNGDGSVSSMYEYDKHGNPTLSKYYYSDGRVHETKYEFEYDKNDNITEILFKEYNDGELTSKSKYEFEYNDDGNCISETYNRYDGDGKLMSRSKFEGEYDSDENLVSQITFEYNGDKELQSKQKTEFEYDENRHCTKKTVFAYDGKGKLTEKAVYTFEDPFVIYDPEGTGLNDYVNEYYY